MVTAESIVNGIPVIGTKCGGPENFINNENGILVSIKSEDELVHAMKKMILNINEYSKDKVSSSIAINFSKEGIANTLLEHYQRVVK